MDGIFRKYDIRGIVEKELNAEVAYLIGCAYGTLLCQSGEQRKKISIGRDVRPSSAEIAQALAEGVVSTGIDVVDVGVCPTPVQYFSLFHLQTDGGLMVTGSHNPPEYNGIKLSIGRETIFGDQIQQIKEIIKKGRFLKASTKGTITEYDILTAYEEYLLKEFSYLASPEYIQPKVVVDAGNGTASLIVPRLLEKLGCRVIPLYCEPDGTFPNHHPDPTVLEYIQDMISLTVSEKADLGVGYDGDADRIGVVDGRGRVVWPDQLLVLFSRELLQTHKGAKIIADVKCSEFLFEEINRCGGRAVMWKTGHSLIKNRMKQEQALLAGEFSGHIFFRDRYFGFDDAIYATVRLIEILKKNHSSLEQLLHDFPVSYSTPEIRIACEEDKKQPVIEMIIKRLKGYIHGENSYNILALNTLDGVRIKFPEGWALVRPSNTQPVLVVRVEAYNEEALQKYKTFIEEEINNSLIDTGVKV